jgi:hypothetical protein
MTQELTLITKAATLVVDSQESMIQAATLTGKLKDVKKATAAEEEELSEQLAKLDLTKQYEAKREFRLKVEKAIKFVSDQVNKYQTAQARIAAEAEAKLAARVEKGTMKLDTAVRKMDEIEKPLEEFKTADGSVSFKTIPKLDITDAMLIPRKYLVVDEVAVFKALKAGETIPGAQIIQVKSLNNR